MRAQVKIGCEKGSIIILNFKNALKHSKNEILILHRVYMRLILKHTSNFCQVHCALRTEE